jgi:hypothetical protein
MLIRKRVLQIISPIIILPCLKQDPGCGLNEIIHGNT